MDDFRKSRRLFLFPFRLRDKRRGLLSLSGERLFVGCGWVPAFVIRCI